MKKITKYAPTNFESETDEEDLEVYYYVNLVLKSGHVVEAYMRSKQEADDTVERIATVINSNSRVSTERPKRVVKVGERYVDYAEIASFHVTCRVL